MTSMSLRRKALSSSLKSPSGSSTSIRPSSSSSQGTSSPVSGLQRGFLSSTSAASSGPSSFPRRAPLPGQDSTGRVRVGVPGGARAASSGGQPKLEEIKDDVEEASNNMARRLTRFYTANFERRPIITLCVTNSVLSTVGDAAAQLIPILSASQGVPIPDWDFSRTVRFAAFGFSLGPLIEKWNRFLEYRFPLKSLDKAFGEMPGHSDLPFSKEKSSEFDLNLAEKLKRDAEREGFRVNIERGPNNPAPSEKGKEKVVDPQHVAMPHLGSQPGQISVVALFKRVAADQLFMAPLGLAIFISTMAVLEGLEWEELKERYHRLYWSILLVNWQIWPFVQLINFRYLPLRYRVPFSASLGVLWTVFLSFKNAAATTPAVTVKG